MVTRRVVKKMLPYRSPLARTNKRTTLLTHFSVEKVSKSLIAKLGFPYL